MSQQNVDLVRRAMDAWNREDVDALIPLSDPEVEFVSVFAGMEGRTYQGYEGLRSYFADMRDAWAEFHREIEEVRDAGDDRVVVFFRLQGVARASGVPVDERVTTVFDLREGHLLRMVVFRDRDEALKAAGLEQSGNRRLEARMDLGVHLPLMEFRDEGQSLARLQATADAARECGFAALSANDHFVFSTPWLDGPTALASVIERSGDLALATTISLVALRGPVQLAKSLAALDLLSGGRLIAGLGPGSSKRDYDALGVPFEQRWPRFEESVTILRALLGGAPHHRDPRFYAVPDDVLMPTPVQDGGVPLWIGSWGSDAGIRRVARLADEWLASAYNTTPERFALGRERLAEEAHRRGRGRGEFPNALVTMWMWVTEDRVESEEVLRAVLAPRLNRDPDELREQVCVGSAEHCAELLSRYAAAGCQRVYLWPLGDEARQLERVAGAVAPHIAP